MFSKIAFQNVKRSFQDYTIYFLTLTFAVCIFYSFNSIESQQAMMELNASQANYVEILNTMLSGVSVFVSFILGGLIVYANNFLTKKRKREFGIYMSLGMSRGKIANLLLLETILIGFLSLGVGLIVGIIISQGLSIFTAKLFAVGLTNYNFIISTAAIMKTIMYFALIFFITSLFNTSVIKKYKLIDLMNATKKNETFKIKNPVIAVIVFLTGITFLIAAYVLIIKVGLNVGTPLFWGSCVLGILGTFAFYFGLSGFLLSTVKNSKNIYFHQLNIFITKQISSKVNTNFISMSVICLMLFITIGMLSTGLSFKYSIESELESTTPFDASAYVYLDRDDKFQSMADIIEQLNLSFEFTETMDYMVFDMYRLKDLTIKDLIYPYVEAGMQKELNNGYWNYVYGIKLSDYNEIQRLKGKNPIELKENEVMLTSNFTTLEKPLHNLVKERESITYQNKELTIKDHEIKDEALYSSGIKDNILTLILPDNVLDSHEVSMGYFNVNYLSEPEQTEAKLVNLFRKTIKGDMENSDIFLIGYTKQEIYESNRGVSIVVLFVGIYLGIVFLISSAAVLALQQLSEGSDSITRYESLRKIGATRQMINRSIFIQTAINFMLPLGLAVIHSIVGIYVVNDLLSMYGKGSIVISSFITGFIMLVVYGGYFYATYTGYKSIIKNTK